MASSSSGSKYTITGGFIDYDYLTDAQMRQQAENAVNPLVEQQKLASKQSAESAINTFNNQQKALEVGRDRDLGEINRQYDDMRRRTSDQALGRGLARSTIAVQMGQQVSDNQARSVQQLQRDYATRQDAIASQIALTTKQLNDALASFDITRAIQIQAKVDELANQQRQIKLQVDQFNNQTRLQVDQFNAQAQQQQDQFEANMALQRAQMARQQAAARSAPRRSAAPAAAQDNTIQGAIARDLRAMPSYEDAFNYLRKQNAKYRLSDADYNYLHGIAASIPTKSQKMSSAYYYLQGE